MIPDHEIGTMFNQMTLEEFVAGPLWSNEQPFGSYFDFIEYMWSLRTRSNVLIVFFEEIKLVRCIKVSLCNDIMNMKNVHTHQYWPSISSSLSVWAHLSVTNIEREGNSLHNYFTKSTNYYKLNIILNDCL